MCVYDLEEEGRVRSKRERIAKTEEREKGGGGEGEEIRKRGMRRSKN